MYGCGKCAETEILSYDGRAYEHVMEKCNGTVEQYFWKSECGDGINDCPNGDDEDPENDKCVRARLAPSTGSTAERRLTAATGPPFATVPTAQSTLTTAPFLTTGPLLPTVPTGPTLPTGPPLRTLLTFITGTTSTTEPTLTTEPVSKYPPKLGKHPV